MGPGFKILSQTTVAPTGVPIEVARPIRGSFIISRIAITSRWPLPEGSGFFPSPERYGKNRYPIFNNKGAYFTGFPNKFAQAGYRNYSSDSHYSRDCLLTSVRDSSYNDYSKLIESPQSPQSRGCYSLFQLEVDGTPIIGVTASPDYGDELSLKGPFTINHAQALSVTNGMTRYKYDYSFKVWNQSYWQNLISDHRARANSLQVTVFGQEVN